MYKYLNLHLTQSDLNLSNQHIYRITSKMLMNEYVNNEDVNNNEYVNNEDVNVNE